MIKKILTLSVLAVLMSVSAAMASDLSSVGTTGVEATADYGYARSVGTSTYDAAHEALTGFQFNAGGWGSFDLEAGDTQTVTTDRVNYPTFTFGYANGVDLGGLKLTAFGAYEITTGDTWLPWIHGQNSSIPTDIVSAGAEASVPLDRTVRLFVDYEHSWVTNSATPFNDATVVGGLYLHLTNRLIAKVGGGHVYSASINEWTTIASLSYKL